MANRVIITAVLIGSIASFALCPSIDKVFAQTKPTPPAPVSIKDSTLNNSLVISGNNNNVTQNITNIIIITLGENNKSRKQRVEEIINKLKKASPNERAILEIELADAISQLQNPTQSLAERKTKLAEPYIQLENQKNATNKAAIEKAQQGLKKGDTAETEKLFKETLAKGGKQAAMSASQLGGIAQQKIEYEKADFYFKKAIELESDNPKYLTDAGIMAHRLGRYDEAKRLYKRSLEIQEKSPGPDQLYLAINLNNLAQIFRDQGEIFQDHRNYSKATSLYAEAEPLYKRSLEILEKSLGSDHPKVAASLNNLTALYINQGKYAEAESLIKRSLSIKEKKLGPDHPDIAASLNNLALSYNAQGRYAEAEELYKHAIASMEEVAGPTHPDLERMYSKYALFLRKLDREAEAVEYERKAKQVKENHEKTNKGAK